MPDKPSLFAAPVTELEALRAELRCILQHPAIAPARQQVAAEQICQCTEAARLRHWLALAVDECGRWEEQTLAAESCGGQCMMAGKLSRA
ncbi:hypothetical protein ACFST9_13960 [Hymenobacter monticola]|uniref:Uncharacterized protein n=2 Tax=Hymenobacter TaxID=89966 RepID=A0ABY4BFP9_9BACT|nr:MULTISPECIES: hypothetical protein [Hymenobacter]MDU0372293.1 hypothetical protein [Hymenobacter endophyticus]UOE36571.1 hypothetical protein MTP16_24655 [Hymenobacter monticola]